MSVHVTGISPISNAEVLAAAAKIEINKSPGDAIKKKPELFKELFRKCV